MQIIFEDENEGSNSGRTSAVGPLVCTGRISGHIERECNGGIGDRRNGV